jgi:hypothetical protein
MHLALILALFQPKALQPVKNDRALQARLLRIRTAREERGYREPRRGFFDRARCHHIMHGRTWRRTAMQYWFKHDSDMYSCLFENVFGKTLAHLDALSEAGYDAMRGAEAIWNAAPEKQIPSVSGSYWADLRVVANRLIAPEETTQPRAIQMTRFD